MVNLKEAEHQMQCGLSVSMICTNAFYILFCSKPSQTNNSNIQGGLPKGEDVMKGEVTMTIKRMLYLICTTKQNCLNLRAVCSLTLMQGTSHISSQIKNTICEQSEETDD